MSRLNDAVRHTGRRPQGDMLELRELPTPWELEPAPAPLVPRQPLDAPSTLVTAAVARRRPPAAMWLALGIGIIAAAGVALAFWPSPPSDLRIAGIIESNEVVVAARFTGRLVELLVEEGDRVEAGAIIGSLDRAELDAERDRREAALVQLTAKLSQNRQLVTLESERTAGRLAVAEAAVGASRRQHEQAAAELEQRRADAERARSLYETGLIPRQDFERIETDVKVGEALLESRASAVASAEAELALAGTAKRQVEVAAAEVERTLAEVRQAEAQIAEIAARLDETAIRAPLTGTISLRVAREGEIVEAGRPIVTIVEDGSRWVRAAIDESEAPRVRAGQQLAVELASGARVTGTVSYVAAEAEFATRRDVSREQRDVRTLAIRVALPPDASGAHPGLTAYVLLPRAEGG
jgi:multidrug resistance efflux pump